MGFQPQQLGKHQIWGCNRIEVLMILVMCEIEVIHLSGFLLVNDI